MTNGSLDFEKPLYELEKRISELRQFTSEKDIDFSAEIRTLEQKAESLREQIYANLTPWQRVLLARHPRRPLSLDYIDRIFDDFLELHGDRNYRDDKAIVGGLGLLDGEPVTVIAEQKGKDTKENIARSFGWPYPEGYRKALRLMKQAEKFGRPVVTFIDTAGAFPGLEAEERGQAEAIARNLFEMAQLTVPIVCVVLGEGGSGGALAIGVGNRVYMLENAIYSVISPEGCAAILWHDAELKAQAAEALKLTAADLLKLGVIHGIIPEPIGGAHRDYDEAARRVKEVLLRSLAELHKLSPEERKAQRYAHYRGLGHVVRPGDS
jgi:acetyl-CoA carboxylase carboxyl transferase subunit alpha